MPKLSANEANFAEKENEQNGPTTSMKINTCHFTLASQVVQSMLFETGCLRDQRQRPKKKGREEDRPWTLKVSSRSGAGPRIHLSTRHASTPSSTIVVSQSSERERKLIQALDAQAIMPAR